jgi:hypothetical protein
VRKFVLRNIVNLASAFHVHGESLDCVHSATESAVLPPIRRQTLSSAWSRPTTSASRRFATLAGSHSLFGWPKPVQLIEL